jgi:hypothetical protein
MHEHAFVCKRMTLIVCVGVHLWYVYSVVVAWGVFLPQLGKEKGVGNRYIPLRSLRVSTCEVTTIHTDNSSGLLCAADARGNVCVWEVFEDNKHASTSSGSSTSRSTSSPPKQTHTGDAVGAASAAGTSAGPCTGACQHLRVKKTSAQFRSAVSANQCGQRCGCQRGRRCGGRGHRGVLCAQ